MLLLEDLPLLFHLTLEIILQLPHSLCTHTLEKRTHALTHSLVQIAQRVFVNDVVVRFHKSLELEEDEVKTLICRYPAPLAPASSGNGLVHELEPSAPASGYNSGG